MDEQNGPQEDTKLSAVDAEALIERLLVGYANRDAAQTNPQFAGWGAALSNVKRMTYQRIDYDTHRAGLKAAAATGQYRSYEGVIAYLLAIKAKIGEAANVTRGVISAVAQYADQTPVFDIPAAPEASADA